jgi:hypothetical protein
MSQATYTPDVGHNDAAALSFFNNVFAAIASSNAGDAEPAETYPYMVWADTSGAAVAWKVRNAANNGWGDLFKIATQAVAEAGTNNTDFMTALSTKQAVDKVVDAIPSPLGDVVAWVSFDQTGAIRASGNVSSITDVGTGHFRINFATALADTDYAAVGSCRRNSTTGRLFTSFGSNTDYYSTTVLTVETLSDGGGNQDPTHVGVIIMR